MYTVNYIKLLSEILINILHISENEKIISEYLYKN